MRAPVFRTIDRPSRLFGLELFDANLWASSFILLKWSFGLALLVIATSWVALFVLRFRRPPRFLLSFVRHHVHLRLGRNRFTSATRERQRLPWLSVVR